MKRRSLSDWLDTLAAWVLALLWIAPLLYAFWAAFHPAAYATRFDLFAPLTLENFAEALSQAPFPRFALNTFILVTMILAGQLLLCTLAAYAFARFNFFGASVAFALVLVQLLITPEILLVENYATLSRLGLVDTITGIGLPYMDYLQLDDRRPPGTGLHALRIKPGGLSPAHEHTSDEWFYVLEGDLVDHDGVRYEKGDMEMIGRIVESRFKRGKGKWGPTEEMEGAIVFIGSVASQGNKGQISYASAKAALEGAASTLMKEAIFHGVRCSIIHPGFTDTPILRAMRTATLIAEADIVVVRFGEKYKQWNAAFDAGYAVAKGKPIITLHPPEHDHALKEVDAAANAMAREPHQVVQALAYIIRGEMPGRAGRAAAE